MRWKGVLVRSFFALVAAGSVPSANAQTAETLESRTIAPGVSYRQLRDAAGPFIMHVLTIDLRRSGLDVRVLRARDSLKGREKPSNMARRLAQRGDTVLAAVNGDFFELKSGENENEQVIDGEWWKGLKVTDSPYDTYDNVHTQLAFDDRQHPYMGRFILDGVALHASVATPILDVNFNPSGKPEGTALYTSRFGATTPRDTARPTVEAPLDSVGRRGDTIVYVRREAVGHASGSPIPTHGAVLAAYGAGLRRDEVRAMADGDTIRVLLRTLPRIGRAAHASPRLVIGGWPRILENGVVVVSSAPTTEGTISQNAEMRHPRTAVGFSRDSSTLILLAVDGRSENSGGMTLTELAKRMESLGAWQAMNVDGGGSTTMFVKGAVVNSPSDPTGERAVGNALVIVKRRR